MRTSAIVAQAEMGRGVSQEHVSERLVTVRMTPPLHALREETPRALGHRSQDFVAFARATGGDLRRLATACPRVTQGTPLGTTGLLVTQAPPPATRGRPEEPRPLLLEPDEARDRSEMLCHQPGLWKRHPHVVESGTDILTVGEHAARTPAQAPEEHRVPTSRLTAHDEGAGLEERHQPVLLLGG